MNTVGTTERTEENTAIDPLNDTEYKALKNKSRFPEKTTKTHRRLSRKKNQNSTTIFIYAHQRHNRSQEYTCYTKEDNHRGRKRPMHLSSFLEIYSRI
jgi:hypothetical protein